MNYRILLPISVLILVLMMVSLFFIVDSIAVHFSYLEKNEQAHQLVYNELSRKKEELLKESDVIQLNWLQTLNPLVKEVRGSVIWSNTKQSGIMVFTGLPNPQKTEIYRLWIYDLERSFNTPISAATLKHDYKYKSTHAQPLIIPFQPDQQLGFPYKFELVLEKADSNRSLNESSKKVSPLLLAQP